jgi:AraC-like DNA-binding protein
MRIDSMLVRLLEKLIDAVGEAASQARTGRFAAPLAEWEGRDVLDFLDRLRAAAGDDYMGVGSAPCPLGMADFIIELASRCETLREAIDSGFRLLGMVTSALSFRLVEEGAQAVIEIRQAPSLRDPDHVLADWSMIVWHKMSQWLIGAEVWLDRTEFDHALDAPYSAYAAMFGANCVFNADASRLVFASAYLDRRVIRTSSEGERLKRETPGDLTRQVSVARTWKQLIISLLRSEIARGAPPSTIEDVAAEFGVSSQTLRRRLAAEGECFRSLKAEARFEIALDVLAAQEGGVGEASLAAGFADPNALTRALKRSRGISAQQLREQARAWASGRDGGRG